MATGNPGNIRSAGARAARTPASDTRGDSLISHRHLVITWNPRELAVRKLEPPNPLFYQGALSEGFSAHPGDSVTVGKTRFYYSKQEFALISAARKPRVNECFQAESDALDEILNTTRSSPRS